MNELRIFSSDEFGQIRTAEINGKPYFVASDVATALGYATPRDAIARHCKGVVKRDTPTSGGTQELSYINEGDVYRLIMRSKLPAAEKFESWVMDEVIPSIRKNGGYIAGQENQIGQKRLFEWMRNNGYLVKFGASKNMPMQRYIEQGLFEVKESNVQNPDGSVRITRTTKVTGKGQVYFVNKFIGETS